MNSPWKHHFKFFRHPGNCYLDSAATTQVPQSVVDSICQYLSNGCGNPGRGSHSQSELATNAIEICRQKVSSFVHCNPKQVVFTKGTTESINLVATNIGKQLTSNDSILVTQLEHHANLLPWQRISQQTGARLNIIPISQKGELDLSLVENFLADNCKIFAFTHCSNVTGETLKIEGLCELAQRYQVKTLIDGAQAISHTVLDLKKTNCDFYAFSGHKIYAGGGSGVLYAKEPNQLSPLLLGGGIVKRVTSDHFSLLDGFQKLEAGSSNMTAIVGLRAAIEFIESIGMEKIKNHEQKLTAKLYKAINQLENYQLISHPKSTNIVSFHHKNIHCHDISTFLAESGISIRAGHHCAEPCVKALGVKHCIRASIGMYNDEKDIQYLINQLKNAEQLLS